MSTLSKTPCRRCGGQVGNLPHQRGTRGHVRYERSPGRIQNAGPGEKPDDGENIIGIRDERYPHLAGVLPLCVRLKPVPRYQSIRAQCVAGSRRVF